jgi:hypothetical protein
MLKTDDAFCSTSGDFHELAARGVLKEDRETSRAPPESCRFDIRSPKRARKGFDT